MMGRLKSAMQRASSSAGSRASGKKPAASRSVRYATSPLLASPTPPWRSKLLVALVGLGFLALIGRAVFVQIIGSDFYLKEGDRRYAARFEVPASRGRILDRNGQLLAGSIAAPAIAASPKDFTADREQRRQLARLLGISTLELQNKLDDHPNFVWLDRQVEEPTAAKIRAMKIPGVVVERGFRRSYPEGEAAAHIVGFTNIDEHGQEGIELALQQQLEGRNGSRNVVRTRYGDVVEDTGGSVAPVDGRDIQLSIDAKIQGLAYQRIRDAVQLHKAKAGSVVVLDAQSGEILALANYPSYNPTERRRLTGEQLRNRAITDVFEPGSTVKPFVASLVLQKGLVKPETVIDTMPFMVGPLRVNDGAHAHPQLTVAQVIQKSSNVGTVHLSQKLESREMGEMLAQLGFGSKPQIGFPGAATGRLRPWASWKPVEKATMSYGYGLSASLLQIARAYTAIARDGEMAPLTLVQGSEPVPGVRVFEPDTARTMRHLLRGTVSPEGTAPKAQPLGYSAGGKTGTAEKQEGKGYNSDKHRAWFTGIAPIENPRIVVAVMVDEPSAGKHFGGDVAAPVFAQLVEQTLRMMGVPNDLDVRAQIVAKDMRGADPKSNETF